METTATSPTGFSWGDLGKTVLSKGLDLTDSFAAIAVAKEQSKVETRVQAAEVAANAAPQNTGTKANSAPALSTGAKIGIGAGVAAVLGLILWAVFGGRRK